MDAESVLRAFAELSPSGAPTGLDVAQRKSEFVWLGVSGTTMLSPPTFAASRMPSDPDINRRIGRLAAIDRLHKGERLLRAGWVFLAGTVTVGGKRTRMLLPLLSAPVAVGRLSTLLNGALAPRPAGDRELTTLVASADLRADLEERAEFGGGALMPVHYGAREDVPEDEQIDHAALLPKLDRLNGWIAEVTRAAGLEIDEILPPDENPLDHRGGNRLVAVVGTAMYVARDVDRPSIATSLQNWAAIGSAERTAFGRLYRGQPGEHVDEDVTEDELDPRLIDSPLPLTVTQRRAVIRSRHSPVTVVSGPPGTGKSHAVVGIALDAVARGESVLIATRGESAAEVIADLIEDHDGPTPVLFGGSDRREQIAETLSDGASDAIPAIEVRQELDLAREAGQRSRQARSTIGGRLEREVETADAVAQQDTLALLLAPAPGFRSDKPKLDEAENLLERARSDEGAFGGFRKSRADARLRKMAGATADTSLDDLAVALEAARHNEILRNAVHSGGLSLVGQWEGIEQLDLAARAARARALSIEHRARLGANNKSIRAVAALAAALRSGRGTRRRLLRELEGPPLIEAMPLWIGTLGDIDDILPQIPGLFDLVILDEASQIDQPAAASALLRAGRSVVVGDPRQLRHVSFVSDAVVQETLERNGLADGGDLSRLLDVRRVSMFDLAAGNASVTQLDEHFRCLPHLIDFSLRRFYDDHVGLMTRHPSTETVDAIECRFVEASRSDVTERVDTESGADDDPSVGGDGSGPADSAPTKTNEAEVVQIIAELEALTEAGARSVGVLTPFRAQADAIESAILEHVDLATIDRLDLRVGTVHAFQGAERDVIILSLGLTPDDPANRHRFVEDPHLFNVMVSRARKRTIIVTSLTPTTAKGELVAAYLRHADQPLAARDTSAPQKAWPRSLHDAFVTAGLPTRANYEVGRWTIDLVIGEGDRALGIICSVHPDGPDAHIDRELGLRAAGWRLADAFGSRAIGHEAEIAAELSTYI